MTKNAFLYLILFLFLGGTTAGCWGCFGSDDEEAAETEITREEEGGGESEENPPESIAEAMEHAEEAMEQAQEAMEQAFGGEGGVVKKSVDFRKLKDLLPDEVDGLERTSAEGERTSAMGMQFSQATGEYEDGNQWLEITISDLGTLTGFARMGFAAWLNVEVDRESDSGFERTRKFSAGGKEYPSFEKFEGDGDEGDCEIQIWVAERFIVGVEGRNVEMDQCEEARDEISYRQLDRMKNEGTEAE